MMPEFGIRTAERKASVAVTEGLIFSGQNRRGVREMSQAIYEARRR